MKPETVGMSSARLARLDKVLQRRYVDGGYLGPVSKSKKFTLSPGSHNVEVRDPGGASVYQQQVQVVPGHTIDISARTGGAAAPPPPPPPSGKAS